MSTIRIVEGLSPREVTCSEILLFAPDTQSPCDFALFQRDDFYIFAIQSAELKLQIKELRCFL